MAGDQVIFPFIVLFVSIFIFHLLLLCSSADVAGAPQVGRDQAIGRHGHSKGNQKLPISYLIVVI